MNDPIDIDWEQLHQVSEDDPEFELELLTMLAEDMKIHIEDLSRAVSDRDCETIAHEAHYIKGASANLGIMSITSVAKQLEQIARDRINEDATPLVEQMRVLLNRLAAYVAIRN